MAHLGVAQVTIRFLKNGQNVENVLHVAVGPVFEQPGADAIYDVVNDWVTGTLRPTQTNDTTYLEVIIEGVNAGDNRYVYPGDGQPGAIANSQAPDNVTIALKKNITTRGRGVNGRFFHIGISVNQIANSRVAPVYLFALVSTYQALRTALDTGGYPMVVLKLNRATHPPTPVSAELVTSITATDNIVDSQRRRLPGRGR